MASKKILDYITADKLSKEADKKKQELREYVGKVLRRAQGLGIDVPGMSYSDEQRYKIDEVNLYTWIKDNYPEDTLNYLTKHIIDLEKLQELVFSGTIDTSQIPESVFQTTKYYRLVVNYKKLEK